MEKMLCPKCSSDQLATNSKGYSAGKAVTGAVLVGGIGLLAGFIGSNKVKVTCLKCGHVFPPGEGKIVKFNDDSSTPEHNAYLCNTCKMINPIKGIACSSCGAKKEGSEETTFSTLLFEDAKCPYCQRKIGSNYKYCPFCKKNLEATKRFNLILFSAVILFFIIFTIIKCS